MIAICKREFQSLFHNVTGWIFFGVTMFFYGLYFNLNQLRQGYGNISYTLSGIMFIFLITAPILTMRIFAEERRSKTDQLVMTAPISTIKIVLGKYLALVAAFTICVALMALSPILLSFFGEVPWVSSYVALLGFYLYGLVCLAIGMWASSLTENQIIAAVLSFVLLFLGYVMTNLTNMISQTGNLLTKVLNCYDIYTPLQDFLGGNLNLVNVTYYVSLVVLCIFLTYEGIQKRRWSVSSRKITFSVFSGVTFVVGLVVIVLLNAGVRAIPSTYTALDFTEQQLYSLTDTTKDYLKTLNQDVTLYYYNTKSAADATVSKLLTNYKTASKHITVKYINPTNNPDFGKQFNEDSIASDSVVVASESAHKVLTYSDLYELTVDYNSYNYVPTGFDGEGKLTAAINYVTSEKRPVIYTLSGHNESTFAGGFAEAAEKANIKLETLNFLAADGVPEDAEAVIIHAPQMDLTADDVTKLRAYLEKGGTLITTLNFQTIDSMNNLKDLLNDYAVTVKNGMVVEQGESSYYQSPYYLLPTVSDAAVNGTLAGSLSVFVPYSLGLSYEENENYTYTPLMTTSEYAFLSEAKEPSDTIAPKDTDEVGPFTIALNATADNGSSLYLYGSAYTFTDSADQMVSGRNSMLFGQLLTTVADVDADSSIVVPVKSFDKPTLTVTEYAIRMYGWLWCIIIPAGSIVAGIAIWALRRRK
ncbi:MAG: Gldg family protein [Lachnospiraceae bacterium]|nr:Gldg family protein [Lachnospiraceae bacterium]